MAWYWVLVIVGSGVAVLAVLILIVWLCTREVFRPLSPCPLLSPSHQATATGFGFVEELRGTSVPVSHLEGKRKRSVHLRCI